MPGKTIALTIDSGLQQEVERVLVQVGSEYSPKSATAIAVDPSTGAILALANWVAPGQSANIPADQAVGFSYKPGSTFKAITVAGALQDGLVTPGTQFDIPPSLSFASNEPPIHDAEDHGYETLTVAGILKYSSNIGADLIGQRLGAQRFNGWVHRFGFGFSDRDRPARRGRRDHPAAVAVLGRVDVQPALRPGRIGHADADGGRV